LCSQEPATESYPESIEVPILIPCFFKTL